MRIYNILSLFALLLLTSTLCAQYNSQNLKLDMSGAILKNYTYKNLGIYPVRSNDVFRMAHREIGTYTNLADAIEKKKIVVTETSGGANNSRGGSSGVVNTLMAKNVSADSIYIMAGELVKGGKQDRVIAQDIIIAPGESVDLSVFCVEQGRWSYSGEPQSGFSNYEGVSGIGVRKAAEVEKNQGKVWDMVASDLKTSDTNSLTSNYNALLNSDKLKKEMEDYAGHFTNAYKNDADIIGVVVVSGDKVIACDLFATHQLFTSNYENMLQSYIVEAILKGEKVSATPETVNQYLEKILADESKQEEVVKSQGNMFKHNGKKIRISSY